MTPVVEKMDSECDAEKKKPFKKIYISVYKYTGCLDFFLFKKNRKKTKRMMDGEYKTYTHTEQD